MASLAHYLDECLAHEMFGMQMEKTVRPGSYAKFCCFDAQPVCLNNSR
jgi:hypothetical protein